MVVWFHLYVFIPNKIYGLRTFKLNYFVLETLLYIFSRIITIMLQVGDIISFFFPKGGKLNFTSINNISKVTQNSNSNSSDSKNHLLFITLL